MLVVHVSELTVHAGTATQRGFEFAMKRLLYSQEGRYDGLSFQQSNFKLVMRILEIMSLDLHRDAGLSFGSTMT